MPDWCCHSEAPPTGREFQKRSPAAEKLLSPGGVRVLCPSRSQQSRSQGWARVGGVLAKVREKLKIWQEYSQHCLMDRQMRVAAAGVKMQDDAPVSDADREKVLQNVIVWKIFREGLVFWWENYRKTQWTVVERSSQRPAQPSIHVYLYLYLSRTQTRTHCKAVVLPLWKCYCGALLLS